VTDQFVAGAHRVLEFCQKFSVEKAILKFDSPSCGSQYTYDGSFSDTTIPGRGIPAELLEQNRIKVYNDKNFRNGVSTRAVEGK
jgi:uncharacterized protein YbbK (DUF523 family)